jgi:hypothetical protein
MRSRGVWECECIRCGTRFGLVEDWKAMTRSGLGRGLAVLCLATMSTGAVSHGGGLDKYGCHHNRRTGDYHCHRSGYVVPTPSTSSRSGISTKLFPASPQKAPVPAVGGSLWGSGAESDQSSAVREARWIASHADGVYFRAGCSAAMDRAPSNRRYFDTEDLGTGAGYRRSRVPGC